jgi:CubicO group peptidase (beta-lactamase class C family)
MEGASGTDFLTFMRDEVFEPLGLRHTVADRNEAIVPDRTRFYELGEDGTLVNAPYVDNSYKWAGGGFLSTPEDLVVFGQAHMEPGFLTAETLAELQRAQSRTDGSSTDYGIGWGTGAQDDGDATLSHSGGSVGGTTLLLLVPAHDLVVAGVVNISGPAPEMVREVARIFEEHLEGGR